MERHTCRTTLAPSGRSARLARVDGRRDGSRATAYLPHRPVRILAIPEPEAPAGGTGTATGHPARLARRCWRAPIKPAPLPWSGRLPARRASPGPRAGSLGGPLGLFALRASRRAWREPSGAAAESRPRALSAARAARLSGRLDAANVRRAFRRITAQAGLNPADWTPRELRHSFVSLLSDNGVSLEHIADLCGHSGTTVTEKVYRHQLRPVLMAGATVMDRIFSDG